LPEITELLIRRGNGDHAAWDQLIPLVFADLADGESPAAQRIKQVAQTFQFAFSATFETDRKPPVEGGKVFGAK
jgi:hypothetical protein